MLALRGIRVLGIASATNDAWLREHGAVPVNYGTDLADRLRAAAPAGIDAFIDLFGPGYVQLAVALGIDRDRIQTIISFQMAHLLGTKSESSESVSNRGVLTEMAGLVASGAIEIPIAATYPLDRVRDAYAELEQRHTRGKIVLIP
jgi:NADPH:quinone reductase-like Zn-dependent oxidoreductase